LAEAYEAKGDKKAAMAELDRYAHTGGHSPVPLKKLATLQEESGDKKAAAASLKRINYIYPVQDEDLHKRLGDLYMELGQVDSARVEYEVVIASKPIDPAGAHFRLAEAFRKANRTDLAQEQLLMSLEAAPGYRPAQKMLLELNRESAAKKE
jgi:tetratricopeptide (TPR) repeat protein